MVRLKSWQWVILAFPVILIIAFLLVAAVTQINEWGINWIWGIVTLMLVGWRSLLVRWTRSQIDEVEAAIASVNQEIEKPGFYVEFGEETDMAGRNPVSGLKQLEGDEATKTVEAALQKILTESQSDRPIWEKVEQKPVNILLVGRTGAGKSSLINTIFQSELAEVDVLPSTDRIQSYHWQTDTGESLTLWDPPGYEQANKSEFRDQVLEYASNADLLLLVTPALDPALQMDADFLKDMKEEVEDLPAIAIVTQVDRLRPIREWQPPYDWVWSDRPKEKSIREATEYRSEMLGEFCDRVLPVVSFDSKGDRPAWNADTLSLGLIEAIGPVKQLRLARFLRDLESRTVAAAKIIDAATHVLLLRT